jgi:hypothetical protein
MRPCFFQPTVTKPSQDLNPVRIDNRAGIDPSFLNHWQQLLYRAVFNDLKSTALPYGPEVGFWNFRT